MNAEPMPCALMPLSIKAKRIYASIGHAREEFIVLCRLDKCASMQDKETAKTIGHCCGFNVCVHVAGSVSCLCGAIIALASIAVNAIGKLSDER